MRILFTNFLCISLLLAKRIFFLSFADGNHGNICLPVQQPLLVLNTEWACEDLEQKKIWRNSTTIFIEA